MAITVGDGCDQQIISGEFINTEDHARACRQRDELIALLTESLNYIKETKDCVDAQAMTGYYGTERLIQKLAAAIAVKE